ncbi:MAG: hypothetical protein ACYCX4_02725 [Bacillota bacterium]
MDIKKIIQQILQAAKSGGSLIGDRGKAIIMAAVGASIGVEDKGKWRADWKIEKYHGDAIPENLFAVEHIPGNLLLNDGITLLLNLLIGAAGTAYNNANARIGVGDSTTAAAATQTGLQAAVNKAWKAMDATYPQVAGQTVTFRSTFGVAEANYAWKEFTVVNAADDTGTNLNRKVEDHGVKASGDSWVISLTISIS